LFEPMNARRLFPCFDEPRWRSIFKLQLWLEDDFASPGVDDKAKMNPDWNGTGFELFFCTGKTFIELGEFLCELWPSNADDESEAAGWTSFASTLFHELVHQWNELDVIGDVTTIPLVSSNWSSGVVPSIVYRKGSAIVSLLNDVVGADKMRLIFRDYVRKNQWKSANTTTFLRIVDRIAKNLPISASAFFASWLYQGSHPIVFIDYDKITSQFCLTQVPKAGDMGVRWYIPIWIECLAGTSNETIYWILPHQQLVLGLDQESVISLEKAEDQVTLNAAFKTCA
uniref:Peptidase_M1_N domain-containing protein n=1 Tax=Anisakis simplex TaxID=6269 RepID=A0A0M3K2G0_ANISI